MPYCGLMWYYQSFLTAIPLYRAGYPRVTHPSATKFRITRFHLNSVRLACVRHAASVHPEPGSNSHVKSLILCFLKINVNFVCFLKKLTRLCLSVFWIIQILNVSIRFVHCWTKFIWNFQGCFIIKLSMFVFACCLFCDSLYILTHLFSFVKHFFYFFQCLFF